MKDLVLLISPRIGIAPDEDMQIWPFTMGPDVPSNSLPVVHFFLFPVKFDKMLIIPQDGPSVELFLGLGVVDFFFAVIRVTSCFLAFL